MKRKNNVWRENGFSGKKAQVQYFIENLFRIGFLMIALLAFFLLTSYYINNKVETRVLQAEVLSNRILYSDAIMYEDTDTMKVYAGLIDMDKLNDTRIESSINYTYRRHISAKIKVLSKADENNPERFIQEAYLNRDQYYNVMPYIDSGIKGKGSGIMIVKRFPATCIDPQMKYNNGKSYYYCTLVMEIIVPNS